LASTANADTSNDKKGKSKIIRTVSGKRSLSNVGKGKDKVNELKEKYDKVLPLTRIYMTICTLLTVLSLLLGDELSQGLFALTPQTLPFQLHRLITASAYLGPPSISSLMSVYHLYEYGSSLEKLFGTSTFLLFLSSQIILLSILASLFMTPFFGNSVITAMLHVVARQQPNEKVGWLVFKIPFWMLPFGTMVAEVLQQQSGAAALPHIMGIITGHFFHFHTKIWPAVGGKEWLIMPDFIKARLDEDGVLNDGERKKIKRKRGKGVKLGSV